MALAKFISRIVTSITKDTFKFNKTLDVLIAQFEDSCPTTEELVVLIGQKNFINGALEAIQKKIENLNTVAQTSEVLVGALSTATTFIKQLPLPTSFPPGVGIPLSIINTFSDTLDNLGDIIKKEEGSLDSIPEALEVIKNDVGEVITKLNDLGVGLDICLNADPNITQATINTVAATTGNFDGVLSATDLNEMLNTSPGLLYGDYYLRLTTIPTDNFSFDKKQIVAQNKESVLGGDYYNEEIPIEELLGDESFSSSNIVLVNEMKWLIDTKDLIFPPPPPAEDPLKALYKQSQLLILQSIYGADPEESEELYERAWEFANNRGPNAGNYQKLQEEAFEASRTLLEQAVANEGYEFKEGDRILAASISKLFFSNITNEPQKKALIQQVKSEARKLFLEAENVGEQYYPITKKWKEEDLFETSTNPRLAAYARRLRSTSNYDTGLDPNFEQNYSLAIQEEVLTRKPSYQAIYEAANILYLDTRGIAPLADMEFNDSLQPYFNDRLIGYNSVQILGQDIIPEGDRVISINQLEDLYIMEQTTTSLLYVASPPYTNIGSNSSPVEATSFGLTFQNQYSYSKNRLILRMLQVFGLAWYNENIRYYSSLPFWSKTVNSFSPLDPEGITFNFSNDPNYQDQSAGISELLVPVTDPWYFAFGKNDLPIPPPNPIPPPEPGWWW